MMLIPARKTLRYIVPAGGLLAGLAIFCWWQTDARYIQSTDDAYVGGNITAVSTRVPGYITHIDVADNQLVKKGDVILRLDDSDYRAVVRQFDARLKKNMANLDSIRADLAVQHSVIRSAGADQQAAELAALKSQLDSQRYDLLAKSAAISQQIKDNTRLDTRRLIARQRKTQNDVITEMKRLEGLAAREKMAEASVEEARAELEQARLNLQYTVVRAPIDGIVGNRHARTGSWVSGGQQLASLVPLSGL